MSGEEKPRKIVVESGGGKRLEGEFSIDLGRRDDVQELREVLSAVSGFIRELKEPLDSLVKTLLNIIEGEKVGRDVAAFYKQLREAGVPEDLANEMTRRYFEQRMSTFNLLKKLGDLMGAGRPSQREEPGQGE